MVVNWKDLASYERLLAALVSASDNKVRAYPNISDRFWRSVTHTYRSILSALPTFTDKALRTTVSKAASARPKKMPKRSLLKLLRDQPPRTATTRLLFLHLRRPKVGSFCFL